MADVERTASDHRIEELSGDECRALLRRSHVGRLGVVRGGYPLIFPVNYGFHGERVVIRTHAGAKLRGALYHRVSFEIDEIDYESRCGWSVLVQGFGTELTARDPGYAAMRHLTPAPWAPGERDRLLVIAPISITGRRITRRPDG